MSRRPDCEPEPGKRPFWLNITGRIVREITYQSSLSVNGTTGWMFTNPSGRPKSSAVSMWNWWRSTLFSWYPNVIAIDPAGSWPLWSVRTIIFYGLSVVLWLGYFYAFFRLR